MQKVHDRPSRSPARASATGLPPDAETAPGDDVLSGVLASVRLTGSLLFLVNATTPWSTWAPDAGSLGPVVLPQAQHLISYHIVTQGRCCAGLCGGSCEDFEAGDVFIVPHGDAYFLADSPATRVQHDEDEAVAFFREMALGRLPPVVTVGGGGPRGVQLICGFLGCDRRPFNPVLASLPRTIHWRTGSASTERMKHLVELARAELLEQRSGRQAVLLRLAELMFVEMTRRHFQEADASGGGWLAGLHDPLVAHALASLHGQPARHWTLAALADEAGASRSVLAERFMRFVGQPPMHYLVRWRMQLAARELVEQPAKKLVAVADAVGYQSESAFSRAFKKHTGQAPATWRLRSGC